MTSRDFAYWLQGFFELADGARKDGEPPKPFALSELQTTIIRNHLHMVFAHEIDPSAGPPDHQKKLDELHDALKKHEAKPHGSGGGNPFGPMIRC